MAWVKKIWVPGGTDGWDLTDINRHEDGIDQALTPDEAVRLVGGTGNPGFENAWVNYNSGTHQVAGFWKDRNGVVHIQGLVKSGGVGATIFTLPAGYRPARTEHFATISNGLFGGLSINSAGQVIPDVANNTWFSLAGVNFRV